MPAEKADSIGDDNINATDLWITGEYLNIKYQSTTVTTKIRSTC